MTRCNSTVRLSHVVVVVVVVVIDVVTVVMGTARIVAEYAENGETVLICLCATKACYFNDLAVSRDSHSAS